MKTIYLWVIPVKLFGKIFSPFGDLSFGYYSKGVADIQALLTHCFVGDV